MAGLNIIIVMCWSFSTGEKTIIKKYQRKVFSLVLHGLRHCHPTAGSFPLGGASTVLCSKQNIQLILFSVPTN
jgi:hypothetical protein